MRDIYKVMRELYPLSIKSEADHKHFEEFGMLFVLNDYPGAARHIQAYMEGEGEKSEYQQMLSDLLPHFQVASPEDAETRLFNLILSIKFLHMTGSQDVEKELHYGGAIVANEVYRGESHEPVMKGDSPLMAAIIEGDAFAIKSLLKFNASLDPVTDINKKLNMMGETALHIACRLNIPELIEKTLKKNADPNIKNSAGETALHVAMMHCGERMQLLLLDHGADPNLWVDSANKKATAFVIAYHAKNLKVMKAMIAKGYKLQGFILSHAKEHNPDIYKELTAPYKAKKQELISAGGIRLFKQTENKLSPLYRAIFAEEKEFGDHVKQNFDEIYYHPDPILKPLLDVALLAAKGGHNTGVKNGKKLKIIIPAANNISGVNAHAKSPETHGMYRDTNTIYAAGIPEYRPGALSTLLHEMKHFADMQVYGNSDTPYIDSQKSHFDQVMDQLRVHSEAFMRDKYQTASDIDKEIYKSIASIFTHYKPNLQVPEVMVKVPEIIGILGVDAGVAWLKKNEPALLAFYVHRFNPACETYLKAQAALHSPASSPPSQTK